MQFAPRRLKITYIANSLEIGGAETSLVSLCRYLAQRGHALTVISSGGPLLRDLEGTDVRHIQAPIRLSAGPMVQAVRMVRAHALRDRPDVIHALSAAAALATQLVARAPGGPLIVSSPMGLQNSDREPRSVTFARNALLAFRMQRIFVISQEIERAMRVVPFAARRFVHQNVNGIDLNRFRDVDRGAVGRVLAELGTESAPLITTIGALHPRKSHHLFLHAAKIIAQERPYTRFLIVGEGPERPRLERLRGQLGLDDHVFLLGARRDIPVLLAASAVCVKPGVVEGFVGLTVLEAQAVGTPVVAFDTNDVRAAIDDGETGLLAPNGDVRSLATSILALLQDPARADALARAARRSVEERFSLQAVASGVERTYNEALDAVFDGRVR